MNKRITLSIVIALLFSMAAGYEDEGSLLLEKNILKGCWMRTVETKIPGMPYEVYHTYYRIGIDNFEYRAQDHNAYDYNTVKIVIAYERGGKDLGILYDPSEEYNYDKNYSCLSFKRRMGIPGPVTEDSITFCMPVKDSLFVTTSTEQFGLKRIQ